MLKMADQGKYDFCAVFTMSLCELELKQTFYKFAISNHTALKLDVQALRSYLSLICKYELDILPIKKVSSAKDHGKKLYGGQTTPGQPSFTKSSIATW